MAKFSPSSLPPKVRAAFDMGPLAWPLAVSRAVEAGITNETRLTNIVFHMHHPELKGRDLKATESELRKQWTSFRYLIRPTIPEHKKAAAKKPTSAITTSQMDYPGLNKLFDKFNSDPESMPTEIRKAAADKILLCANSWRDAASDAVDQVVTSKIVDDLSPKAGAQYLKVAFTLSGLFLPFMNLPKGVVMGATMLSGLNSAAGDTPGSKSIGPWLQEKFLDGIDGTRDRMIEKLPHEAARIWSQKCWILGPFLEALMEQIFKSKYLLRNAAGGEFWEVRTKEIRHDVKAKLLKQLEKIEKQIEEAAEERQFQRNLHDTTTFPQNKWMFQ